MSFTEINTTQLFKILEGDSRILHELPDDVYSVVDSTSKSLAIFDCSSKYCTHFAYPGMFFKFKPVDFLLAVKYLKKDIIEIPSLSEFTNSLPPDFKLYDQISPHSESDSCMKFKNLTDWFLISSIEAVRFYKGQDQSFYSSRAAYINKSGRVRVRDNQWINTNIRSSDYGLSESNLEAADLLLARLGFK